MPRKTQDVVTSVTHLPNHSSYGRAVLECKRQPLCLIPSRFLSNALGRIGAFPYGFRLESNHICVLFKVYAGLIAAPGS